jgi:hypothetical protein
VESKGSVAFSWRLYVGSGGVGVDSVAVTEGKSVVPYIGTQSLIT